MRFALCSDLHNEFYSGKAPDLPIADADYLVLAGDIQTVKSHDRAWWDRNCAPYKNVIYIPGNHEYYKTYFSDYPYLDFPDNVILAGFKQNSVLMVLDGVSILAGTMWSDLSDPHAFVMAKDQMNDYRQIKFNRNRYWFTPQDTTDEFHKFKNVLTKTKPDVVISHHAPSQQSLNPAYSYYGKLNMAYYSNMDLTGIKLWMHGHTHYPVDYTQDGCRVVSNPAGYPGELPEFNMKVFEI